MKRLAILFLCVQAAFALSASEAMEKSKVWFKSSKAWSFKFRAESFLAGEPSSNIQKGDLLVGEGNRFRLSIPGITFISDGESLWQWNIEQKQVLIKAVADLESSLHPSELLFKYLNCKALSLKEESWKSKKVYVLKLSPDQYADQFAEMEVWLSDKDFSPVRLYTVDVMGNSTWYDVSEWKTLKNVDKEKFKFKSSPGVDEIDMR